VGEQWALYMEEKLRSMIGQKLGISSPITASIYKLLLYEPGSFFKAHRDTAKERGMFGTLVIQLPSAYEGGEIQIHHDEMSRLFLFSSSAQPAGQNLAAFVAFYCDCEHEILPVTSGYRLCLIYNLSAAGPSITQIYSQPRFDELKEELKTILRKWPIVDDDEVEMLLYVLSHKYSEEELSFPLLKTTDQLKAALLTSVAAEVNISVHVGLIYRHLSGYTDYAPESDEEDPSDCEIYWECSKDFRRSTYCKVSNLKSPAGISYPYRCKFEFHDGNMEKNILPENAFDKVKPLGLEINVTGNEGTTAQKWYREAALIVWQEDPFYGFSTDERAEAHFLETLKKLERKPDSEKDLREAAEIFLPIKPLPYRSQRLYFDPVKVIATICGLHSLEVMKRFLRAFPCIQNECVSLLQPHLDKFGLENFMEEVKVMVEKAEKPCEMVTRLLGEKLDEEKRKAFLKSLLQYILEKKWYGSNLHPDNGSTLLKLVKEADDPALFTLLLKTTVDFFMPGTDWS